MADPDGRTDAGQCYVVYGSPSPGIRVTPTAGLTTTEAGGQAFFLVALGAPPTSDVTIPVNSGNLAEATVSTTSLTFTPANWNVPQVVTITGVDDAARDGDISYTIVLGTAASVDLVYNGVDPADVAVVNSDNDVATVNRTYTKTENRAIPDLKTITSTQAISDAGTILDLNVRVNIRHTYDADLDVYLIAPDGTRVELFTDVGVGCQLHQHRPER